MKEKKKINQRRSAVDAPKVKAKTARAFDEAFKANTLTLGCGKELHRLMGENRFIEGENIEKLVAIIFKNLVHEFKDEIEFLSRRVAADGSLPAQFIDLTPEPGLRKNHLNETEFVLRWGCGWRGKATDEKRRTESDRRELWMNIQINLHHPKYRHIRNLLMKSTKLGEHDD